MMTAGGNRQASVDALMQLFHSHGATAYLGEPVTVADHMLQCAALAEAEGAADTLVVAALLHDIGHLVGLEGRYTSEDEHDRHHEKAGARFLDDLFPQAVVEPVGLHVAAKRYLCATDRAYFDILSTASRHTLMLQGGPMRPDEVAAFERRSFHADAVRLRRWDDHAKIANAAVPPIESFLPMIEGILAG